MILDTKKSVSIVFGNHPKKCLNCVEMRHYTINTEMRKRKTSLKHHFSVVVLINHSV